MEINPTIFRAYDIRGIVDLDLTEQTVLLLGKAIGEQTLKNNDSQVVVARDGRLSSPKLATQLMQGIISTGCNVVDLGLVPTPLMYFATHTLNISSGVMITGSHNPAHYNGLKIILNNQTIHGEQILQLKNLVINNNFKIIDPNNLGVIKINNNIIINYINYVINNIKIKNKKLNKKLKIAIDCGNGAASIVAVPLFVTLGIECIPLYCEVDGNFPNHHPDPSNPDNLTQLKQTVIANKADLGLAFDGDGDRLGVIDNQGNIVWPDRYLMLFIQDILANPEYKNSTVIYDIKSTNNLDTIIKNAGGQPLMWKTGHSLVKAKMQQTNAILAGEMSGHVFFKDRWFGFDDALYTAARLAELIINNNAKLNNMLENLPQNFATPELVIPTTESDKQQIINKFINLIKQNITNNKIFKITTIDGLRIEFNDCWGLIRASNTAPNLIARFEAINQATLSNIKTIFKNHLLSIDPKLSIPF